jgi:hypothetical protein
LRAYLRLNFEGDYCMSFDEWYATCLCFCVNNFIGPDDYVWDLRRCDEWREKYNSGLTPEQAVKITFEAN